MPVHEKSTLARDRQQVVDSVAALPNRSSLRGKAACLVNPTLWPSELCHGANS
jgi:hypothetical protein